MAETSVSASFSIDVSQLRKKIYYRFGRESVGVFVNELNTGLDEAGDRARHEANVLIKGGEASNLAKAARKSLFASTSAQGVIVDWNSARSVTGFPYAAAVNTGRKAFGPINAKVLHFVIDGKDVFAKRVREFAGVHFTTRGLEAAKPAFPGIIHAVVYRWSVKTGGSV